ncbi:hypothetical protein ABMY26_06300 (plasmid) [Azospirillum sp. HJ39]|uniref:hypothetical protein n=1 Tax=Azospirillum sp. HJ39 TaxID=3159496 RepID=UPI003558EB22
MSTGPDDQDASWNERWNERMRGRGVERADQDKTLLGYTLDPDREYADKPFPWRSGYRERAAQLRPAGRRR